MGQQFAQLIHNDGYLGMKDYIGKVFPVIGRSPRGHYLLKLKEGYCLNFSRESILLLQAVEEPAPKLEWKVGAKVLVKKSSLNANHFKSRVGYVGTIEVIDSDRFKVKFPEASFKPVVEGSHYSSWWWESELELVPDDFEGGKKPMRLKLNDKCYIAGDGKHLTKDISKALMTEDYQKHLSDKFTASFEEIFEEYSEWQMN